MTFVTGFTHQWLGMDRLDFFQFNAKLHPGFDDSTKAAAKLEVFSTVEHLLRNQGRLSSLLKSDFVVINGLLANYYGIGDVHGDEFRPVTLPADSPRGGLLGMAAVSCQWQQWRSDQSGRAGCMGLTKALA